jgi:hypothetical protein
VALRQLGDAGEHGEPGQRIAAIELCSHAKRGHSRGRHEAISVDSAMSERKLKSIIADIRSMVAVLKYFSSKFTDGSVTKKRRSLHRGYPFSSRRPGLQNG